MPQLWLQVEVLRYGAHRLLRAMPDGSVREIAAALRASQ